MKKVGFSDLTWPLKIAAIIGWIAFFFAVLGFVAGFIDGVLGL